MASLHSHRKDAVQAIQEITGYTFNDQSLLSEAVEAADFRNKDGNKDLALPGGAILKVFIIMEGRQRHQNRKTIASNANLAKKAVELGLKDYIQNNPAQGNLISQGPLATAMEAIIGAIYIDSDRDYSVLSEVITRMGLGWPR
ncbi:RNAse III, putative [Talaromyces stipitatus ATCC 10500]|uniref:RNAse III, putative n=1 Tax=Talaromyces stipitatus (strain ATCC 10500 / CBS 375.48 / QM 6759 / NRRL 1006) TaxID=441959 RepID=B8LTY3_TALSN|nr:RNAse III, putative [Talaromyces stipitatus ATCC 10500]EED23813.1 RNAse III, putative [Talaromyces stipitatus ATCC 10500]